ALARTTGTYLDLGIVMVLQQPVQSHFFLDESILIDPTGSVVWRYEKAHPTPGEQEAPGDGNVPTVQTPYGRLATVVCYDADFPMQGVRTIYAMIGDLFAWLSVAGLVVLIGVAIARRRKAGEAGEAAPISAESSSGEPIEAVSTSGELTEPRPSSGEPPAASPT